MSTLQKIEDYNDQIRELRSKVKDLKKQRQENLNIMRGNLNEIITDFYLSGFSENDTVKTLTHWLSNAHKDEGQIVKENWAKLTEPQLNLQPKTYKKANQKKTVHVEQPKEEYKFIDGYVYRYQVTNKGRVYDVTKKKYLKQREVTGKLMVTLSNGSQCGKCVHMLVAKYFCSNPFGYKYVRFKNGDVNDCRAVNLEWTKDSPRWNTSAKPKEDKQEEQLKEIFMDIEGYKGLYKISNFGRVYGINKKMMLKSIRGVSVELWKDNIRKKISISKLVAEHFISYNGSGRLIHIDDDKTNHRVDNLEYLKSEV